MAEQKKNTQQNTQEIANRQAFLMEVPEPTVQKVWLESLGKSVYMKQLSATDQDSFESELVNLKDQEDGTVKTESNMQAMRSKYVVRCLCDAEGNRFFKDSEYNELGMKLGHVVRELYEKASEINGAEKAQLEDERKNS